MEKEGDRVIWERLPYGAFVRKPVKQAAFLGRWRVFGTWGALSPQDSGLSTSSPGRAWHGVDTQREYRWMDGKCHCYHLPWSSDPWRCESAKEEERGREKTPVLSFLSECFSRWGTSSLKSRWKKRPSTEHLLLWRQLTSQQNDSEVPACYRKCFGTRRQECTCVVSAGPFQSKELFWRKCFKRTMQCCAVLWTNVQRNLGLQNTPQLQVLFYTLRRKERHCLLNIVLIFIVTNVET